MSESLDYFLAALKSTLPSVAVVFRVRLESARQIETAIYDLRY
jgi:hypothetical protein